MEDIKYVLFTRDARVLSKCKFDMALAREKSWLISSPPATVISSSRKYFRKQTFARYSFGFLVCDRVRHSEYTLHKSQPAFALSSFITHFIPLASHSPLMLEATAPVAAAAGRVEVAPLEDVGRRERGHPLLHRHRRLPPLPRRGRRRHQASAVAGGLRGRSQQGGRCKNNFVKGIVVIHSSAQSDS